MKILINCSHCIVVVRFTVLLLGHSLHLNDKTEKMRVFKIETVQIVI